MQPCKCVRAIATAQLHRVVYSTIEIHTRGRRAAAALPTVVDRRYRICSYASATHASRGCDSMGWVHGTLLVLGSVLAAQIAAQKSSGEVPVFDRARPDAMPAPKTNAAIALESHGKGRGVRPGARQYWSSAHCETPFKYRPEGGTRHPCINEDLTLTGGSSAKGEHVFENGLRICKNHAIRGQLARCTFGFA